MNLAQQAWASGCVLRSEAILADIVVHGGNRCWNQVFRLDQDGKVVEFFEAANASESGARAQSQVEGAHLVIDFKKYVVMLTHAEAIPYHSPTLFEQILTGLLVLEPSESWR